MNKWLARVIIRGGGLQPKKYRKKTKKNEKTSVPNLKFAVAFSFFGIFRVFFDFLWYFFGFFRFELRQEIPANQKSSQQ